ncbi:hypothetical protein EMIT036CA2_100072 [Chryseobacterium sp. IT-36CA2]
MNHEFKILFVSKQITWINFFSISMYIKNKNPFRELSERVVW